MLPDGGHLVVARGGVGPALLALHGFSLDHRVWRPMAPALEADFSLIAPDLRGFGAASLPQGVYAHTDDLIALLDALELPRVVVMGLSMGGGVAVDLALEHPGRVAAVIVVDGTLGGFRGTLDWRVKTEGCTLRESIAAWLAHPLFAWPRRDPQVAAALDEITADYSGWHWRQRDPQRRPARRAAERLSELDVPLLALVGEHDLPDFHAVALKLAAEVPGARHAMLAGIGHLPPLEAPADTAARVIDFARVALG